MSLPPSAAGIAAGYAFTGPALDLGALLWDGSCLPEAQVRIPLPMLTRHGLVAGATGTGKTRTLQLIAEQLSAQGVPVFLADIKGDLSGISVPGTPNAKVASRSAEVGHEWAGSGTVRTFPDSAYDLEELLTGLGTGEAVVTVLSEKGAPTPVAATRLRAPESLMGPVDGTVLDRAVKGSALYGRYAQAVDRESAYEKLAARAAAEDVVPVERSAGREESGKPRRGGEDRSVVEQVVGSGMFRSLARSVGTQIGREITRSLFGTARRRR
ncbi:helicase HerA-like domain-containing protein [Streptomyces bobili]|uniref:helicase HerA-like domain-containing protein n=1 Tax=Streptomyces bobili TaxID=67280 RepID=UPI0036FA182C